MTKLVKCLICEKEFRSINSTHLKSHSINSTHLKSHSITFAEYLEKFSGAVTVSQDTSSKLSLNTKKLNSNRDYSTIGEKISQTRIHRSKFMKHTLIEKDGDEKKTEWELMQERGYDRIWDCGTMVYKWEKI